MEPVDPADIKSAVKLLREARPFLYDLERTLQSQAAVHNYDESSPAMHQLDSVYQTLERVTDAIKCLTTHQR